MNSFSGKIVGFFSVGFPCAWVKKVSVQSSLAHLEIRKEKWGWGTHFNSTETFYINLLASISSVTTARSEILIQIPHRWQASSRFLKAVEQSLCDWGSTLDSRLYSKRFDFHDFHVEIRLQLQNLWVYILHKILWPLTMAASHSKWFLSCFPHLGISFSFFKINSTVRKEFFCLFKQSISFSL